MIKFKPVTNTNYVICDKCNVPSDNLEIYEKIDKDMHLCQYCSYAKNHYKTKIFKGEDGMLHKRT